MRKTACPLFLCLLIIVVSCAKPKAPDFVGVENIELRSFSLQETKLGVKVKMFNPNNQRLQVKSADLDLFVNNELLGHSLLDSVIDIPKKDTFYIPLEVRVQTLGTAARMVQSLADTSVMLKVTGVARLGRSGVFMNYPINYEGKQNLQR
jgi:LEA14-like dessication related protein